MWISIRQHVFFLSGLIIATLVIMGWINTITYENIVLAEKRNLHAPLFDILGKTKKTDTIELHSQPIPIKFLPMLGLEGEHELHLGSQNGKPFAALIPSISRDGYGGNISMIIALKRDGSVLGVRILAHSETAGLGDKIELSKDNWILAFDGRSLANSPSESWALEKDGGDFDQFTGASITPRAVITQVFETLKYFEQDGQRLFARKSNEQGQE
jgi:electron transport complex protein RnfG